MFTGILIDKHDGHDRARLREIDDSELPMAR